MNKVDFERWQAIEDEFLNSDLDEVAFCKSRKISLEWFRQKLSDAERHEQKTKQQNSKNLFVELVPQSEGKPDKLASSNLKVKFRGATFELFPGFSVDVFRQALQVVREVV